MTTTAPQQAVSYTGSLDAICPVTFAPLEEIRCPVVFRARPHQPYELRALLKWLSIRMVEPLTGLPVTWQSSPTEIIAPLIDRCEDPGRVGNLLVLWGNMEIRYRIIGLIPDMQVLGLAPRADLQNCLAYEWEAPPMGVQHVSYVYVTASESLNRLASTASAWGATHYGKTNIHVDEDRFHLNSFLPLFLACLTRRMCVFCRDSYIIYHSDGAQLSFIDVPTISCLIVLQTKRNGSKKIHLVHQPHMIYPSTSPAMHESHTSNTPTQRENVVLELAALERP